MAVSLQRSGTEVVTKMKDNVQLPTDQGIVNYLLECPVCAEYMTGRVCLCVMGHSMCECCFDTLLHSKRSCPLCRKPLNSLAARNFFLENLAALCKFKCKYADRGCEMEVEGYMYAIHKRECKLRDFKCGTYGIQQICEKYPLKYKDFIDHLIHDHEIPVVASGSWIKKIFSVQNEIISTPFVLIQFEDVVFFFLTTSLPQGCFSKQTFYEYMFTRWVMKLDEEKEPSDLSENYKFELLTEYVGEVELENRLNTLEGFTENTNSGYQLVNSHPFMETVVRQGRPLPLSQFPRDSRRWTKEDDNSLFGFSTIRDFLGLEAKIVWREKVIISKIL